MMIVVSILPLVRRLVDVTLRIGSLFLYAVYALAARPTDPQLLTITLVYMMKTPRWCGIDGSIDG